jgi:hypothetical protein
MRRIELRICLTHTSIYDPPAQLLTTQDPTHTPSSHAKYIPHAQEITNSFRISLFRFFLLLLLS